MTDNASAPRNAGKDVLPVLCLVRDLLFYSKIRAAAQTTGTALKSLRDPMLLSNQIGRGLLVDLDQENALQTAIAWQRVTQRPVIAFVSHVNTETITTARAAGITRILARSQFEQNLPKILTDLVAENPNH